MLRAPGGGNRPRPPSSPPLGSNLKEDKLAILERPYPRAVAGTPERFSFDPRTGTFELRYATAPAGTGSLTPELETEIYLPDRHYGRGYTADVQGAGVVSATGDRILRLVSLAGAERVVARVLPA
jgi:endoglycosylceramidase